MIKRIVIAGSRNFSDYDLFTQSVNESLSQLKTKHTLIIISGHCQGTDLMAERYAKDNNLELEIFPANWKRYGRGAGPKRNKEMIDIADYAIAFSSGGKGTLSLIALAIKKGIPIKVYTV